MRLRAGLQVEPERVGVEGRARVHEAQLPRCRLALERGVVVGPDLALREIGLPRLQAQQFGVLVRRDLEREPVEIRQLRARRVLAPVLRVARQDDALARLVRLDHERPEAHDVGRRRGRAPLLTERAGLEGRIQLVPREDRQRVEQAQSRAEHRREGDHDGVRIARGDGEGLAADKQRVAERAAGLLVVRRLEREHDVGRGERRAVREGDARRSFRVQDNASGEQVYDSASHGSSCCVARLMRSSRAWVRPMTRLDAKSRPACGLNVRGSLRMVATSDPLASRLSPLALPIMGRRLARQRRARTTPSARWWWPPGRQSRRPPTDGTLLSSEKPRAWSIGRAQPPHQHSHRGAGPVAPADFTDPSPAAQDSSRLQAYLDCKHGVREGNHETQQLGSRRRGRSLAVRSGACRGAGAPARDFTQLYTYLVPGSTVWVTDAQGREIKGEIGAPEPGAITVRGRGGNNQRLGRPPGDRAPG